MSIEQQQQQLAVCYSNSQDPSLQMAAKAINEYTEYCKNGQISKEEYVQLLQDIQSQINIRREVSDQNTLNTVNTVINSLINIATMIG
jgi:hypothetical protein